VSATFPSVASVAGCQRLDGGSAVTVPLLAQALRELVALRCELLAREGVEPVDVGAMRLVHA
jgi:hypothetical protein